MARSSDPTKYPVAFFQLLAKVTAEGEVFVAHPHPTSFRGLLQAFLRALESDPTKAEQAKQIMVRLAPKDGPLGVLVCDRDRSPAALAVLAALGNAPLTPPTSAEARLFDKVASIPAKPAKESPPF